MIDYAQILTRRYSGKLWTLVGDNYDGLTWISETNKPTKNELDLLWPAVQKEILDEKNTKIIKRTEILNRLGLTSDELDELLS